MKQPAYTRPWETPPVPKFFNREDTLDFVGGRKILEILHTEFGLKPCRKQHRLTLYSTEEVIDACRGLRLGFSMNEAMQPEPTLA